VSNELKLLTEDVKRVFGITTYMRRPMNPGGFWFLDVCLDDYLVVVEWAEGKGFGVTSVNDDDAGWGEGPDESYDTREEATQRVLDLLHTRDETRRGDI
jgi:hypothetical protein